MATCDTAGCTGHLGKFEDCVSEALWGLSCDHSYVDRFAGSTEYEGHHALIDAREWSEEDRVIEVFDGGPTVRIDAAIYVVLSTDQGFVYVDSTTDRAMADRHMDEVEEAHAKWEDQGEGGES